MRAAKERGWESRGRVHADLARARLAGGARRGRHPLPLLAGGRVAPRADRLGRRHARRGRRPGHAAHALHALRRRRGDGRLAGATRTRVIWHIHTPHFKGAAAFARNYLKYAVFGRRADQILCVSPDLVDTITQRGAPRKKVEFLHNAVDVDRFPVLTDEQRHAARDEFGLPGGPAAAGPLRLGLDAQGRRRVRGGAAAPARRPTRAWPASRSAAAMTRARSGERLGLGDELTVLEPTDKVQQMYAAADVFVAPSRAEGTPFSVLEAVSSGTAAVVSDIPGHATVGAHAPGVRDHAARPRRDGGRDPPAAGARARPGRRGLAGRARVAAREPRPRPLGRGHGRPLRAPRGLTPPSPGPNSGCPTTGG